MATGKITKASFDIAGNTRVIVDQAKTDGLLDRIVQKGPNGWPVLHIKGDYDAVTAFINDHYIMNDPNNGDALDFIDQD